MAASKNFQIDLQAYDGDHKITDYFFDQIDSISKIYKWSPEITTQFMRGKQTSPALNHFIKNQKNIFVHRP